MTPEFEAFPKLARLNRTIFVTEKIDGTNAAVVIHQPSELIYKGEIYGGFLCVETQIGRVLVGAQSRKRLIAPGNDNFGFAAWVRENAQALADRLGVGRHFGEWWGQGIQRGYDLDHKRFSLFNTGRWTANSPDDGDYRCVEAPLCYVVPVMGVYDTFDSSGVEWQMDLLRQDGSRAAPGFMDPEGVVIYHSAANVLFKATLDNDEMPKGLVQK